MVKNKLYSAMSRIPNTDRLSYDTKYPINLNRDHRLTELLVLHAYNCIKHLDESQTLADIFSCHWLTLGLIF